MRLGTFYEYKGYTGTIELFNHRYYGRVLDVQDLITYSGNSVEELYEDFKYVINFHLNELIDIKNKTGELAAMVTCIADDSLLLKQSSCNKCSFCGGELYRVENLVTADDPPMRIWKCRKCSREEYRDV